jgi:puromycin-sensitive aminopeptidase
VFHQLPSTAEPISYQITVEPNPDRGHFSGSETVLINVLAPTREIVLNAADLKIIDAQLTDAAPHAVPQRARVVLQPEQERAVFELARQIQPGKYNLSMKLDGILNDKLRGFYRSSFTDSQGKKHWLATTQMEATDARRMFPCFDEPQYKATFSLSADIDANLVAISNSPIAQETENKQLHKKLVRFEETPKMSSYLLALVVGPFTPTEPVTADGVPIRVWTIPGKTALGSYSLAAAAKILPFYNEYFGVPYPAKKLDLIAIPDFEAGAMENLGAITFRQSRLLVDEKGDSALTKHECASVVAHEMAHMWFGDLVTMRWWDDLWLNEAFATWMSSKAVDRLHPEWHEWDQFIIDKLDSMQTDSLQATRPIHFAVTDPAQVDQMFDDITYGKGASVLRMLEHYVSDDVFRDGVRRYIKAHEFANASTQDLWQAIGEASGKEIKEMMHGWVYQAGYPVVNVDMVPHKKAMGAEQERFFLLSKDNHAFASLWQIPLSLRSLDTESGSEPAPIERAILTDKQDTITVKGNAPYLVNAGADGYYRVRYTPSALKELSDGLEKTLTPSERASLLSDQFQLALAGEMPVQNYLTLTAQFKDESDPSVIKIMIDQIQRLNLLVDDKSRSLFEAFVRDRLQAIKQKLGWSSTAPDEPDLTKTLRAEVLDVMGTIGQDKTTIKEARQALKKYKSKHESLEPDLIAAAADVVAFNGDETDYHTIETLWHSAATPDLERQLMLSLALFRQPLLIERTLAMTLTDQVRNQDGPNLIAAVGDTAAGRKLAFNFITARWRAINARFTEHMVPRMVHSASSLASEQDRARVEQFFANNPMPFGTRTIAKTLEAIAINSAFRQRSGGELSRWLSANLEGSDKIQPSTH